MKKTYIKILKYLFHKIKEKNKDKSMQAMEVLLRLQQFLYFQKYTNNEKFGEPIDSFVYDFDRAYFDPKIMEIQYAEIRNGEYRYAQSREQISTEESGLMQFIDHLMNIIRKSDSKFELRISLDLLFGIRDFSQDNSQLEDINLNFFSKHEYFMGLGDEKYIDQLVEKLLSENHRAL